MLTEVRKATIKEVQNLAYYLALNLYNDFNKSPLQEHRQEAIDLGIKDFTNKYSDDYFKSIKDTTFIESYYNGKILIFRTNIIHNTEQFDGVMVSYQQYYLDNNEFVNVTNNIDIIHKDLLNNVNLSKSGKRNRPPSENSILKTLDIQNYHSKNPTQTIQFCCDKIGLAKSTYFKTKKWLASNPYKI